MRKQLTVLCWLLFSVVAVAQTPPAAPNACAKCHVEGLTQPTTYMSHALESVEKCTVLLEHPSITATIGKYTYHIESKGADSTYSVTDGTDTVTMKVAWAMGASFALGQTYILEKDGQMYESRVSWFRALNGLGLTMGYEGTTPANLTEAAGRQIHNDEKLLLFRLPFHQWRSRQAVNARYVTAWRAVRALPSGDRCAPGGCRRR